MGLCSKVALGMKGTVSVLALSWLWPVPDIRVRGADRRGLELPVLLCPGVWASPRGWWWLLSMPWHPGWRKVGVPSNARPTLSCPQLSHGHSAAWVTLSSFTSCLGSGALDSSGTSVAPVLGNGRLRQGPGLAAAPQLCSPLLHCHLSPPAPCSPLGGCGASLTYSAADRKGAVLNLLEDAPARLCRIAAGTAQCRGAGRACGVRRQLLPRHSPG